MKKRLQKIMLLMLLGPAIGYSQQNQNLLANPGAFDGGTTGWTVTSSGDDGWGVDATGGYGGTPCWISSYNSTTKSQVIDLVALGYSASYLDQQPIVVYAENYKGGDGGSSLSDIYTLNITLMDASGNTIQSFSSGALTCDGTWQTIKGAIRNYGTGLRKIKYEHIGDCANNWAGNYGAMIDDSHLSIGNNISYAGGKSHSLAGWTISANGGDGWVVTTDATYITSSAIDSKYQIIDLLAQGYTAAELDNQPLINYHEWIIGTQPNFSDFYTQTITLLDGSGNTITSNTQSPTPTNAWQLASGSFSAYGPGLRAIKYEHSGNDVEFFAGSYGTQMDDAEISLGASTASGTNEINPNITFSVYPNPARGTITINGNNKISGNTYTITDLSGRELLNGKIINDKTIVDINDLVAGIYFIKVAQSGTKIFTVTGN